MAAKRRMTSPDITRSDSFLEMPRDSRLLYFDLNQETDDDGFIDNVKSVMRLTAASEDSLKLLLVKNLIRDLGDGIFLEVHFRINNTVRPDRYHPTTHLDKALAIYVLSDGSYSLDDGTIKLFDVITKKLSVYGGLPYTQKEDYIVSRKGKSKQKSSSNVVVRYLIDKELITAEQDSDSLRTFIDSSGLCPSEIVDGIQEAVTNSSDNFVRYKIAWIKKVIFNLKDKKDNEAIARAEIDEKVAIAKTNWLDLANTEH